MAWTWRDLGRAIKAARWAFYHADDLTMLKHELEQPLVDGAPTSYTNWQLRLNQWRAARYLGSLPIN